MSSASKQPVGLLRAEEDAMRAPAAATADKPVDKNAPQCRGCSRYHGSVNLELECLRGAVVRLRDEKETLRTSFDAEALKVKEELSSLRQMQAWAMKGLPATPPEIPPVEEEEPEDPGEADRVTNLRSQLIGVAAVIWFSTMTDLEVLRADLKEHGPTEEERGTGSDWEGFDAMLLKMLDAAIEDEGPERPAEP